MVFTSNMFAILGLRSLYTVLAKAAADLKYLEVRAQKYLDLPPPPPPPLTELTELTEPSELIDPLN